MAAEIRYKCDIPSHNNTWGTHVANLLPKVQVSAKEVLVGDVVVQDHAVWVVVRVQIRAYAWVEILDADENSVVCDETRLFWILRRDILVYEPGRVAFE